MQIIIFISIATIVIAIPQGYTKYGPPKFNVLQSIPLTYLPPQNHPPSPESILKAPLPEVISTPLLNLVHVNPQLPPPPPTFKTKYLPPQIPQEPIIKKYFYVHSAPPEPEDHQVKVIKIGQPRTTYRVVFIKTPVQSRPQSIHITTAPNEERTVVYVLTKQADPSEIQTDVNVTPTEPSKPEVFFIKYKTPEEAQHVQHQIQSQYDSLGGTSEVSDEVLAPVTSVVGKLDIPVQQNEQQNLYLPPNKI